MSRITGPRSWIGLPRFRRSTRSRPKRESSSIGSTRRADVASPLFSTAKFLELAVHRFVIQPAGGAPFGADLVEFLALGGDALADRARFLLRRGEPVLHLADLPEQIGVRRAPLLVSHRGNMTAAGGMFKLSHARRALVTIRRCARAFSGWPVRRRCCSPASPPGNAIASRERFPARARPM